MTAANNTYMCTILVLIKLTKFAVALRLRCGSTLETSSQDLLILVVDLFHRNSTGNQQVTINTLLTPGHKLATGSQWPSQGIKHSMLSVIRMIAT